MSEKQTHTVMEDVQGLGYGIVMAAFGIVLLTHLGLVTGQTAGLAVLISYMTGAPFGQVFFLINIPFYLLGWRKMGPVFTLKTFVAVAGLSLFSWLIPQWISFEALSPLFGAVLFGLVSGSALLALFRHGASLGGIGILAVLLQDRLGWRAGWVQLAFDAVLFAAAFLVIEARLVLISFLGALVVNLVIAINHRRDRYVVA